MTDHTHTYQHTPLTTEQLTDALAPFHDPESNRIDVRALEDALHTHDLSGANACYRALVADLCDAASEHNTLATGGARGTAQRWLLRWLLRAAELVVAVVSLLMVAAGLFG